LFCTYFHLRKKYIGECEKNPGYMTTNCAPSCKTCNLIDMSVRCPMDIDLKPALYPGSLNKMFSRIVKNAPGNQTDISEKEKLRMEEIKMPMYTVNILSGPGLDNKGENTIAMDKSSPPWVITFDNFLTEDECQGLIDLGSEFKYKRSEDVGAARFDGSHEGVQSERRTSENAWCSSHDGCRTKEIPQRIHDRIAQVLDIPANNSEDFQLLRYEKGQFYRTHHDFIDHQGMF
jgi:prolyl 4-hydroxylase